MKTKKALLPILASALLLTMGLAACNKPAEGSKTGESSAAQVSSGEEEKIVVTAAGDKKEIQVGETLQLSASVEGVEWSTKNTEVVSVDSKGLVTALSAGSARITAKKDGYANGNITITVNKAPDRAAKYAIGLEDADHYSPTDSWGGSYRTGDTDTPIENNSGATPDSTSLGYFSQGCKETLTFTSNKEFNAEIGVTMAYSSAMDLSSLLKVTFNDAEISMAGKSTEAPETEGSYYEFKTVSFGQQKIKNGNNVLVIEVIGSQAPNMDEFRIFTEETATINVVKPVVLEKIVVTPASAVIEIGGTQQLTTTTQGVSYTSSDANIASVSNSGLVTGVAAGTAEITVHKDGMRDAKVSIRVKAAAQAATVYDLVAGTTVRMELENGEFYCDAGTWLVDMGSSQMGPNHDNGDTPIEDQESASGGMSLGYFNQSSKVTMKFNSPKAGTASFKLAAAAAADYPLKDQVTIKVNDVDVDLTDKVVTGGGESNYYDWKVVDLGNVAVKQGANTFVIEVLASQGCNLDYVDVLLA